MILIASMTLSRWAIFVGRLLVAAGKSEEKFFSAAESLQCKVLSAEYRVLLNRKGNNASAEIAIDCQNLHELNINLI